MVTTPKSLTETPEAILNCPFNPIEGKVFTAHESTGDVPVFEIQTMPTMRKMAISGDSRTADRIRKAFIENPQDYGGEVFLKTMGNIDFNAQLMAYKVPIGTYYPRVREWLFEAFDGMLPDKVYFIQFTSYDAIQLAFHYVTEWQEEKATIMRLGATYEGRILTLRAFKPRAKMNQHESERLMKLMKKSEKIQSARAKAAKKLEAAVTPGTPQASKPYHTLEAGSSITLQPDTGAFSSVKNLRNVVYRYGGMTNKKFAISALDDGSVTITRTA